MNDNESDGIRYSTMIKDKKEMQLLSNLQKGSLGNLAMEFAKSADTRSLAEVYGAIGIFLAMAERNDPEPDRDKLFSLLSTIMDFEFTKQETMQ